jgi:RNA polymerase sigma-70 factor (ECF subfamily)
MKSLHSTTMTLNELYEAALSGDAAEEKALFDKLAVRLRVLAERRIGNRQDCDEVVQEALSIVWRKFRQTEITESFAGWARRILINEVLRYYRDRATRERYVESTGDVDLFCESGPVDHELRDLLQRCLARLCQVNRRYAKVLHMKHNGYSHDEICSELDITYGNLCVILSRARSLLKKCMEKDGQL